MKHSFGRPEAFKPSVNRSKFKNFFNSCSIKAKYSYIYFILKAIGPFDFKVFGPQKAFVKRTVEFIIRNENVQVQEIFVLSKSFFLDC